jgi:UDP-glucose 4-epimerase
VVDALLARGHDVTVVDNFYSGRLENLAPAARAANQHGLTLKIIEADVAAEGTWDALAPHDAVLHFAAQTSVTYSVQRSDFDFQNNVKPVVHLMKWLRRTRARYFLYANSAGALYGEASELPTPEHAPLNPLSPYGATKAFTETYTGALCRALKGSDDWSDDPASERYFSWASLRLGNVFGPRQRTRGEAGVVPIFIEEMAAGRTPVIFGDGTKLRDYVHVSDVTSGFMRALEVIQRTPIDDVFNLATGVETSDQRVFDEVASAVRARAGAELAFKKALGITRPRYHAVRAGEVIRSSLAVAKIHRVLGWKAETEFAEGVRQTVRAYELNPPVMDEASRGAPASP